jgi:hypothetical protein
MDQKNRSKGRIGGVALKGLARGGRYCDIPGRQIISFARPFCRYTTAPFKV